MARSAASPAGLAGLGRALSLLLVLEPGALQIHTGDAIAKPAGPQQQLRIVAAAAQGPADRRARLGLQHQTLEFTPAHRWPLPGFRTMPEEPAGHQGCQTSLPSLLRLSRSAIDGAGDPGS